VRDELVPYAAWTGRIADKLRAMPDVRLTVLDWVRYGDRGVVSTLAWAGFEMGQHAPQYAVGQNLIYDDGTPYDPAYPDGFISWLTALFEAPRVAAIYAGVYADPEAQRFPEGGDAAARFALKAGKGFEDVGTAYFRVSFEAASVAAAGPSFALPASLAGVAGIRAERVATSEEGAETWGVYVLAKEPARLGVPEGGALVEVSLPLADSVSQQVALSLVHFEAVHYGAAAGAGSGLDAATAIVAPRAVVQAAFVSKFDLTGDGKVTLADVDWVRRHLGASQGAPASWTAGAKASDLDADGEVGLADLTLIIAAYEATIP